MREEVSELRDQAMHDVLTGLPNRRHFDMTMSSRIAQLAGYGRRFGPLITDIDKFKLVNDAYGHAAGDIALQSVARTLLAASREGDDVARFGGEEFALTITDVDAATLRIVGERFRALGGRTLVRLDDGDIKVTVSIGEPSARLATPLRASLLALTKLYAANEAGRNRVSLSEDTPESSPPADRS